jgi:glycosyltransferase involved in cell wall biosynthesis
VKLQDILRRISRLSRKKKLAAGAFVSLLALVIVAAYARNPWLLGALLLVLLGATGVAMMGLDRLLRSARRAVRPAPAPAPAALQAQLHSQTRPGALAWWGTAATIPAPKLVQRLTKLRSIDGRDVLASTATSGRWSWKDMAVALEMYRLGGATRRKVQHILEAAPRSTLLQIADLCFRQNILKDDILNAATLYRYVYQRLGVTPFKNKRRGEFFLDSLARTGQGSEVLRLQGIYDAAEMNANDLHLYRANATNPFKDEASDVDGWLSEINEIYEQAGLARLSLAEGSAAAFLRIRAEVPEPVAEGPLVTIVMPVYKPDEFTALAIQSAINQSYRNLEIIIVDDGSGSEFSARLKEWAAADNRIKVVLNEPNAGAYTSRNIGYTMAAGQYVTIFDGDDWQHPQKIELLVQAAMEQTDGRLVSAPWTRTDEDLFFHYRGWRGAFITPAHVSTMFHTDTIRERLGHWDSVRKAADTEFILRYRALVHDDEPLEVTEAPLTLSLVSSTNLSMDDFRLGYRSPDRVSYRDSYEHWHKKIKAGEHGGYLQFPLPKRAFPAPRRFLPDAKQTLELDILFVGDFTETTERSRLMHEHLSQASQEGKRIGLMHFPSMLHTRAIDKSFSSELMEAFSDGRYFRVEVTDRVTSGLVNVYDPTAFQYVREFNSGHSADRVVVWAGEPPYSQTSKKHKYEVGTVERNVQAVFRGPIDWTPLTKVTYQGILNSGYGRRALTQHLRDAEPVEPPLDLTDEQLPALAGVTVGAPEAGEK